MARLASCLVAIFDRPTMGAISVSGGRSRRLRKSGTGVRFVGPMLAIK
jgi:hypothetical protein